MPAMHPRVELKKIQLAGLDRAQEELVCWRNIARLMDLPVGRR